MAVPRYTFDAFDESYHLELGRFVRAFTRLEYWLYQHLCYVAEVSPAIGKALFSGARAEAIISFIRRSYEARSLEIDPLLERIMQHASVLNSARNDVVHFAYFRVFDGMTADNSHRTLPMRVKQLEVSPQILNDMSSDADQGADALWAMLPQKPKTIKPEDWDSFHAPWRYKPPSPASLRPKSQARAPKHGRPPQP